MKYVAPLILVGFLVLVAYLGAGVLGLDYAFGVVIPYLAVATFFVGFVYRILLWARAPVPYRIPTTTGQAKSLSFIKQDRFESPSTLRDVLVRMGMEVLLFRSLFRNSRAQMDEGPNLRYASAKELWLAAMVFHWGLLIIVLRHYRFFLEPVPAFLTAIEAVDGFLQITLPNVYLTNILVVAALGFLLLRRLLDAPIRYLSMPQDYFPLYLLGGIILTGILMRNGVRADVIKVKMLVQSLAHFRPEVPAGIGTIFYVHLFLVSTFAAYFPFSKLVHFGGIFFSPTRNLANNSREKRHVNPFNPTVKPRSYTEYEDEFREKMAKAGLPLEKDS